MGVEFFHADRWTGGHDESKIVLRLRGIKLRFFDQARSLVTIPGPYQQIKLLNM